MQVKEIFSVRYKRWFFSVNDSFHQKAVVTNSDIDYFLQVANNVNEKLHEFYTLLIDLSKSIEEIRNNIYHRTLTEINSYIENQDFEYLFEYCINNQRLNEICEIYNQFAKIKGIKPIEKFRLEAYNKEGILAITSLSQKNKVMAVNIYRVTAERVSNLYTISFKFKSENEFSASHYGRAHRTLHWLDIKKFKDLNVHFYDFCGWYSGNEDNSLLNINKFKEQFGGMKVKEYTGVIYHNPILKILKK